MNDKEFMELMEGFKEYLKAPKTFITNPERQREIKYAEHLAKSIFPDAKVEIKDDPLQLGALIMTVTSFDISVTTETEYALFEELLALTSNFEIYAVDEHTVRFAAVFNNAYIKIS